LSLPGVERAIVRWTRRLSLAAGWLLLGVATLTVVDAGLRYGLSRPIPGTFELTELVLATMIFFGLPYTGLVHGHVAVDVLAARLPPRGQSAMTAVAGLAVAALLAAITWEMGWLAAEVARTGRTTITARIPVFPFMLPVMLASGVAALCALVQAVGAAIRVGQPGLPPPPAQP
jgi:TRAP-type C4-dicarboxylate transport system permease small subunit